MTENEKNQDRAGEKTPENTKPAESPGRKLVLANPLEPFGQSFFEPVPLSEEEAMKIAAMIGFTHFIDIPPGDTLQNVLYKKKAAWKLCGIYLIINSTGTLYVGKSIDMKDRLRHHRCQDPFPDHQWIAFRPCPAEKLAELENAMIARAARARLPLQNRVNAEHRICRTETPELSWCFDDICPPWAQERFLAEGEFHGETVQEQYEDVVRHSIPGEREAWSFFRTERQARGMLEIAHRCLLMAVRNPWQLENLWWAITLPPLRGAAAWDPALALTAGVHTVMKCSCRRNFPEQVKVKFALAKNIADRQTESGKRLVRELERYDVKPGFSAGGWNGRIGENYCAVRGRRYPDRRAMTRDMEREVTRAHACGPFVEIVTPLEHANKVLDNPTVQHAFRLAVMASLRESPCPIGSSHNAIAAFSMRHGFHGLPPVQETAWAAEPGGPAVPVVDWEEEAGAA
ncbi:GIY-YIG nuclease family protein [Sutterella sp.]|uniref:GIY-YIG nuclease family protein n=1 Tax=Sutterella sp. TaxID=1981025 RepID=UPI0026E03D53|nr:GIY-YIG nuclease family protein [Sutterella sp.]MDO5532804.1 GIY-YIG nuclease family protein [Sutterella sp.]